MFKKVLDKVAGKPPAVTDAAPCQKALKLHVGPEAIAPIRATVLQEFQRQANLPGFRKGKAPVDLVARQFAQNIQEETLQRVSRQAIEQAAKDNQLKPVGPFEISKADYTDKGLALEATVEVEPEFTLAAYKGIALTRAPLAVSVEEQTKALASLQESMAKMVPGQEGEEKTRHVPALDDELAKDLGLETLEQLKAHVESKLREQKRAAQAEQLDADLCDQLLKRHAFDVPARLVAHQHERLTREFAVRLLMNGVPEEKVQEELKQFTEQLRTSAERHVKLSFVLDRIAAQEKIDVTQDALLSRLWQVAQRWKKDPAEVRKIFDAKGLWPSVISTIRQEQTTHWLLSQAMIDGVLGGKPAEPALADARAPAAKT
jgi:FKBP-type peptidyl-prolyl cis-trans isomerase (trigger factor)